MDQKQRQELGESHHVWFPICVFGGVIAALLTYAFIGSLISQQASPLVAPTALAAQAYPASQS